MTTDTAHSLADTLNSLIETCRDGHEGFRVAADDVRDSELKTLFTEYSQQRARFIDELQSMVRGLGEKSEKTSSFAGAFHRSWMNFKSVLADGDEHAILAECERGEDSAVAEYHEALAGDELPLHVRTMIQRQAAAVKSAHDRIRDLRDTSEEMLQRALANPPTRHPEVFVEGAAPSAPQFVESQVTRR